MGEKRLHPLEGHADRVWSIALSPDGCVIASGSWDSTVRIWDTETGKTTTEPFADHTGEVNSVAFFDHGQLIISASDDKTIRVWDKRTRRPVGTLINAGSPVWSIAASPNGKMLVAACQDAKIKGYDMASRAMSFEGTSHSSAVRSTTFSSDGRYIASGSCDGTIRIWDGANGTETGRPLGKHDGWVNSVSFSPDGRHIASASQDRTVRLWNLENRDGKQLVSGSGDKTMMIWDTHNLGIQTKVLDRDAAEGYATDISSITSTMTPEEIVSQLSARGCADMTDQLDMTTCSERPISSGGFGDIYRCTLKNGVEVAIKTIRLYEDSSERDQKVLKYAARELYTWSKCKHINVQPLLGLVMFRGQIGMIARWESNGSLPLYLERHAEANRCIMSTQIAEGLLYLHDSGVIHGDLKGANVLVSRYGVAQLADFGNATLNEYTLMFSKTSTKESLSPRWAAPELFRGAKCSVQADIYALGMTILETITGDVPYPDKTEYAVMFAVMFEKAYPERPDTHIPNSEQGDSLWSLLKSCWEFEPEKRPSAAEVARKMAGITDEGLRRKKDRNMSEVNEIK
ncbi:Tyrosine kinase family catalytic domain protein [Ceratobasidium sp. AG-Ba]|nr:Tyrosine kinase family catalytic domain protein [Ceratobasidium sp. AG-Ba]